MSDDQQPESWLRANVYVDGELDLDAIAGVEADPAVMVDVDRLRDLQANVGAVEPPASHARETAITAALAEFDQLRRGTTPAAAPVVPLRRRPKYTMWLGAAAAVVAVGMLGVLLTRVTGNDDSDSAGDAAQFEATAESDAGGDADRSAAENADDQAVAAEESASTMAPMLAIESAPAPAATEAPAGTEAPAATAVADAGEAAAPEGSSLSRFVVLTEPIADDVALGVVGRQLLEQSAKGTPDTVPDTPCDDDAESLIDLLGEGSMSVSGSPRLVIVAIDHATDTIIAIDPGTCVVLATGT